MAVVSAMTPLAMTAEQCRSFEERGFILIRAKLEHALKDLGLDETWHTGPYAERACGLLRSHRDGVYALLESYDAKASRANMSSAG